jgi:hypothetical protein
MLHDSRMRDCTSVDRAYLRSGFRNEETNYRVRLPSGTDADRPTLPGGRGTLGPRGSGCTWRGGGGFPKPKKFRDTGGAGWNGALD